METGRFTVFENGSSKNGKIFRICGQEHFSDLLNGICRRFSNQEITSLYTVDGAEIIYADLIRNDEILYALKRGEEFKPAVPTSVVTPTASGAVAAAFGTNSDFVQLNVGGTLFVTSKTSLRSGGNPDSMLAKMFDSDANFQPSSMDSNGAYLIDRDPKYFGPILNFLRTGKLIIDNGVNPEGVVEEANFFGIQSLMEQYNLQIEQKKQAKAVENAHQQVLVDNEKIKMKLEKVKLFLESRRATMQETDWVLKLRKEGTLSSNECDHHMFGSRLDWDELVAGTAVNKMLMSVKI